MALPVRSHKYKNFIDIPIPSGEKDADIPEILAFFFLTTFYYSNILKKTVCYAKIWANVCKPTITLYHLWGTPDNNQLDQDKTTVFRQFCIATGITPKT
jgi:hypothetical protein